MTPVVEFVVAVAAALTAAASTAAAGYARRANSRSETALDVLEGPTGSGGLVETVDENRHALLHADLYPPRATDGGSDDE